MKLGENLFQARKRKGLSQEAVAEKLGVSRQTISKWETDETLPDIRQAKKLAVLYGLTLDELIEFDADVQEIQEVINKTTQETVDKINWTKMWAEKYPVLARYQDEVDVAGKKGRNYETYRLDYLFCYFNRHRILLQKTCH